MKKITMSAVALTAIMGSFSSVSAADGMNILNNVKLDAQIRPRYEMVDDGNSAHANANAVTARTKLKVSGNLFDVDGLNASVGVISVNNFGYHSYNAKDGNNYTDGTKPYAVVLDPQKAMISNAEITYKTGDTLLHAGRGQVNLDNQRFIGTVGWRQLERSYDSVFVANNSIKNLSVLAAWVYGLQGVGSIPNNKGPLGEHTYDTNTVLLHAAYTVAPALKVTAYDYMIASFADTYGIALTGNVKLDVAKLNYRAEYAHQTDASMKIHDVSRKANADYYNLDLGANFSGILAGVNYEVLSGTDMNSNAHRTFSTPLATLHKFNGWADQFLATPKGGLVDMNVRLGYKAKDIGKFLVVYHTFTTDKNMLNANGGATDDLGSEIDALYANKIPGVKNLSGLLKYANYSGGSVVGHTNDVTKFWAMVDYKFSTK
jgi:hypothetical protein